MKNSEDSTWLKRLTNRFSERPTKILLIQLGGTLLIALFLILLIAWGVKDDVRGVFIGITLIATVGTTMWLSIRHLRTSYLGTDGRPNPHHNFFFTGTRLLTIVLTLVGLVGALLVYLHHENLFQALGLVVSVIWVAVFLRYFMWSVYHYNINYGLTDEDWEKIESARKREKMGFPVNPEDVKAPDKNPYRSQTFGLPPGTVRGMIAFTLLLGGLSLLIVSFGNEYYTGNQLALIRQQFEFFETAFLMMIAFYFGDKSLKYLQRRWTTNAPEVKDEEGNWIKSKQPSTREPATGFSTTGIESDDQLLQLENWEMDQLEGEPEPSPTPLTQVRNQLSESALSPLPVQLQGGFVQVRDNIHSKVLSDEEIKQALTQLKEEEGIELTMPVVRAVVEVESSGQGHLPNGKPKILFEGHRFSYWLKKQGFTEAEIKNWQRRHPSIVYSRWTTEHYLGGEDEYRRLELARTIDAKSAVYATSWGLFQMLGENLEHNLRERVRKGAAQDDLYYRDYEDFERKQEVSEYHHFLDFLAFIKTKQVDGTPLVDFISEKNRGNYDWDRFAFGYNGSGYKRNQYDLKLRTAYRKYVEIYSGDKEETPTGFIPIIDAGHGGMSDNQYNTQGKQYTFEDGTQIFEGVINRKIGQQLIELLDEAGIPYHNLTVDEEEDVSLTDRVNVANQLYTRNQNYYLLSIHSNAASNQTSGTGKNASGFEVWTSVGQTTSDELATIAAKWYKREFPEFKFRQDMTDGDEDKEKKHQSETFYVLRKTRGSAFLVENLFYDNRLEAEFLLSSQGQRRIARCLFSIIREINQKFSV
ncbi:N-acetylmuramidase domain-containing protein [Tunicatimonas pelagia]|uniref:N-acetylmuramidase domain-containing protein n=1 Tax=Tunicatimonas pelagia TaxID=931531 RepID=UPI0026652789|nr:N-acetylmuramidase domain-containing protein [Tunicatimonas pelagia]WKN43030.1 N-acetylmuramidase domain-containing protein [Tunicatimonas pelagia]